MAVGGVLFKVFIVGEAVKVVRRFSLPDVSKRELSDNAGVFHFPRVSCVTASAEEAELDPRVGGKPSFLYEFNYIIVYTEICQEHFNMDTYRYGSLFV